MRRHGLVILGALALASFVAAAAGAHTTPHIRAEQQHERAVRAEVAQIGVRLQRVEDQAWNAQQRLAQVKNSLAANTYKLKIARTNFRIAQRRIMQRMFSLYVNGKPTTLDVLAGASSISQAIDRAEAAQTMSQQDTALGRDALHFEQAVQKRQNTLTQLRAKRANDVRTLAAEQHQVQSALGQQRRLLASIHSSIHQLQVEEARREAAERAAAEARLRAEQAAAAAAAAAAAVQQSAGPSFPTISPVLGNGSGHPEAARIALRYLGVPYVWGGASPSSGFDCSGLVMYVYAQLGISLPHYTVSQWDVTEPISSSQMQPGDLVFFDGLGHVGIYIGGGQFVDAPHTGSVVRIDSLAAWGGSFDGARRVP
jgi:cell wall-associated NlpC family hydrolase